MYLMWFSIYFSISARLILWLFLHCRTLEDVGMGILQCGFEHNLMDGYNSLQILMNKLMRISSELCLFNGKMEKQFYCKIKGHYLFKTCGIISYFVFHIRRHWLFCVDRTKGKLFDFSCHNYTLTVLHSLSSPWFCKQA